MNAKIKKTYIPLKHSTFWSLHWHHQNDLLAKFYYSNKLTWDI